MISGTGDPEGTIMSLGFRHPKFGKHHLPGAACKRDSVSIKVHVQGVVAVDA